MLFLGFSAGLPFLLVFSTLSAWLRVFDIDKTTIGFISWIGITYSIKVFWAPVIDSIRVPLLTKILGKRRSWMLLAQLLIVIGLFGMSQIDPREDLTTLIYFALLVAFGSATQDICIDAYRIEAVDPVYQGAMSASYVLGYRLALLVAGAGALNIAYFQSWPVAYTWMSLFALIGLATTLIISEPEINLNKVQILNGSTLVEKFLSWFKQSVINPFVDFFQRFDRLAIIILCLIGLYKLSEITMGVMANPFYIDLGFNEAEIGNIVKFFGFFMTILGAGLGGVLIVRYGIMQPLLLGAIFIPITNLCFIILAHQEPSLYLLAFIVSLDNLTGGFAASAFIAYLSSLVNSDYTATQYALFSSLMTLPAKVIAGFSGVIVDGFGYSLFFLYSGLLGLPALALVIYIMNAVKEEGAG